MLFWHQLSSSCSVCLKFCATKVEVQPQCGDVANEQQVVVVATNLRHKSTANVDDDDDDEDYYY